MSKLSVCVDLLTPGSEQHFNVITTAQLGDSMPQPQPCSRLQKEREKFFGEKDQRPSILPTAFKVMAKKQLKSKFSSSEFQNKNSNKKRTRLGTEFKTSGYNIKSLDLTILLSIYCKIANLWTKLQKKAKNMYLHSTCEAMNSIKPKRLKLKI